MSKKVLNLTIHNAVIRYIGTRNDHAFCIFLPEDPKSPKGAEARHEYARKLTEQTGIEHACSKISNRIYLVAKLINVEHDRTLAHEWFGSLSNEGREWQVSTVEVYPENGTFDLVTSVRRPFCMRINGVKNARIYPETVEKWPDDDMLAAPSCPEPDTDTEPANPFAIKNVIFSNPCTIVFWKDNTKTVVRCGENDYFDPEKGIAMALMRKVYGPRHSYMKVLGP